MGLTEGWNLERGEFILNTMNTRIFGDVNLNDREGEKLAETISGILNELIDPIVSEIKTLGGVKRVIYYE